MKRIEYISYGVIAVFIILGIYFSHTNPEFFEERYAAEDGPLEWTSFVMFLATGGLMVGRAVRLRAKRTTLFLAMTFAAGLLMFFGAGEEISWGQRVFDIETPEVLAAHNKQRETNLHNLEIHGVSVNKLVFSKLLGLGLAFYLLVLTPWAARKPSIARLTEKFAIPLPTKLQVIVWILAMALPEFLVTTSRKHEVREGCSGLIVFATLLNPRNRFIYEAERLEE